MISPLLPTGLVGVTAAAAAEALAGWLSGGSSESEPEPELGESELPATWPLPAVMREERRQLQWWWQQQQLVFVEGPPGSGHCDPLSLANNSGHLSIATVPGCTKAPDPTDHPSFSDTLPSLGLQLYSLIFWARPGSSFLVTLALLCFEGPSQGLTSALSSSPGRTQAAGIKCHSTLHTNWSNSAIFLPTLQYSLDTIYLETASSHTI